MIGADPKFLEAHCARMVERPVARACRHAAAHPRLVHAALAVLFSLTLAHCGKAPNPGALAANVAARPGDSFDDRFPAPQFRDRFPSASESLQLHTAADFAASPTAQATPAAIGKPAPYRLASLEPQGPSQGAHEELTRLVSMKSSAFPYYGSNPASDTPFLNVSNGDRRGHRSFSGRVYWQDQTYNDSRVLVHVPENFDVHRPGVIVVFFHGNGATLERDVRDRQQVPQQISDSGVNAVLLAPQLAVDAADSSAGKFWQPGGFKSFMDEAANDLARLTGDPSAAKAFANMPIVIVGYSGGFLPTAWSLEVGGISDRVRGVVLLDAVYGQLDKFAGWIEHNRSGFFVSAYTHYTARHDRDLMTMLRDKGIAISDDMDRAARPGSVVFVQTPEGLTHRDYVTQAWTRNPIKDVLVKMAAAQPPIRIAAGTSTSASR
jgi:hypothetical protein